MPDRLRVLVLFGGRSAEHDVSRVSARFAAAALDPARYEVVPVAITPEGHWHLATEAQAALAGPADALPDALPVQGVPVTPRIEPGAHALLGLELGAEPVPFDVVLPLLHGPHGEDGTIQGLFELAEVPYVGSGVLGAAVGMDKVMMRRAFAAAGLAMARWLTFRDGHDRDEFAGRVERELGLPCFVKPANLGSSVGVSKARTRDELMAALELASSFDEWVVVEEAIDGREIEVAVLGDDPPEASVPGEIVPGAEFYSYADKYETQGAQLLVPAPLEEHETSAVRMLATRAFEACRCEGMGRVDFLFEGRGPGGGAGTGRGFLVNEVNTIPGFTPISMYPRLWEASGLGYSALLDRLIELALSRQERRTRRTGRPRPA